MCFVDSYVRTYDRLQKSYRFVIVETLFLRVIILSLHKFNGS